MSETLGERNTHISDMRHIKSVAQSGYSNRVLAEIRVYPEIYSRDHFRLKYVNTPVEP